MKIIELRKKTQAELKTLLGEKKIELGELRLKVDSRQLSDVAQIRKVRTTIAQIMTLFSSGDYIDSKPNNK